MQADRAGGQGLPVARLGARDQGDLADRGRVLRLPLGPGVDQRCCKLIAWSDRREAGRDEVITFKAGRSGVHYFLVNPWLRSEGNYALRIVRSPVDLSGVAAGAGERAGCQATTTHPTLAGALAAGEMATPGRRILAGLVSARLMSPASSSAPVAGA
jgi:hypothetical protein